MSHDKIIDRIRKLLALSKSANEHEAAMAAGQAADLMLKHEIEEASLCDAEDTPEGVESETLEKGKQHTSWKRVLANGLCQSFGCQSYGDRLSGMAKTIIVGQPSKLATIRYMYQYLVAEIERLANATYRAHARFTTESARSWKNAFRLGASSAIYKRLLAQREETHAAARIAGQGSALVVVKRSEEAVAAYIKKAVPNLRSSGRASCSSRSGFGAGKSAGERVSLGGGHGLGAGTKQLGGR